VTDERNPWDKLDPEGAQAYIAFRAYLDMGPERTQDGTRKKLGKKSGYLRQIEEWASLYRWEERANAWDTHLWAQIDAAKEERVRKVIAREMDDVERMLAEWDGLMAGTKLHKRRITDVQTETSTDKKTTVKTITQTIELNTMDWYRLVRIRDTIGDQARRAAGLPKQIHQTRLTGEDDGPVDHTIIFGWDDSEEGDQGGHS
jgi:hypothetical protein